VAHELTTGRTRWKTPRPTRAVAEQCDAYTTPVLTQVQGTPCLIVMGGNQLDAYDPRTGAQLWRLPEQVGGRTVTSPAITNELVFATRGKRGDLFAVELEGRGELDRRDVLWTNDQGTPDSCSPVAHRALVFTVSDDGIARCLDAASGKLHWKQRLPGSYRASPIWCAGRILLLNTEGTCTIIAAASRYSKLFENRLDDQTIASPAIAHGHIYLRGRQQLYCIGPGFR
jgi:outer membrane protein assembly factor BamB